MGINKSYGVFGLGRYGRAVAAELVNSGAEVMAVDVDMETVNAAIQEIPFCKCADVTDPEVIKQLGTEELDVVIIAMASNFEASVMATMLCKQVGVETVIAKCANEMHREILCRVGADRVVSPETESGTRLAKNLVSSGFVDIMELSRDVSLVELDIKPEWEGRSLIELNLRKKYAINVVAVKSAGAITCNVDPEKPLVSGTRLVIIGDNDNIAKIR
ncbi:MAG: TrkA family potassium uptake protein [Clostridia bacterium]|nr:TrkA family potassium uptake protein [Clostridia bacterium]